MRPAATLLYTLAVCAVLLAGLGYAIGPVPRASEARPAGLTAATVLANDGMGPTGLPPPAHRVSEGPAREASSAETAAPSS